MSDDTFGPDPLLINDGGKPLLKRVFEALRHHRRRCLLYYLHEHETAEVDDLAVEVVAWEQDVPVHEVSDAEAERCSTNLVHSHLPKLEDYGFVDYDPRSGTVCYTFPPSLLDDALEIAHAIENSQRTHSDHWQE